MLLLTSLCVFRLSTVMLIYTGSHCSCCAWSSFWKHKHQWTKFSKRQHIAYFKPHVPYMGIGVCLYYENITGFETSPSLLGNESTL